MDNLDIENMSDEYDIHPRDILFYKDLFSSVIREINTQSADVVKPVDDDIQFTSVVSRDESLKSINNENKKSWDQKRLDIAKV